MLKRNKKLLLTSLAVFTAIFFILPANVSAALVISGYTDNEGANGNDFSASNLEAEAISVQQGLELAAMAAGMVPGLSVSRDANIKNVGDENFQYKVEFDEVSGDDELCDTLQIQVEKNGAVVYSNDLLDFTVSGGTLNSGDDDDWDFTITMPIGTSHNVENMNCNFNFKFTAWQTIFPAPTQGWVDEEMITDNAITAGDWEPIISGVDNTDTLDTKSATNDDMSKVSVSWSTDENTTSNVIYDTASHATCAGYALASLPADVSADSTDHEVTLSNLTAGTTFYYRAVSEDSGGHVVCSNEYSFDIPASSVDAPSNDIVLNEFVPNKSKDEWVELYNRSGVDVGVNGWYIYDDTNTGGVQITSANTNTGGTIVPAHGWLVVNLNKNYLNNSGGDTVRLYSGVFGTGTLIDKHIYTIDAPEGKSFARFPDGVGVWIDPDTTPGKENQLKEEELEQFRKTAITECFDTEGNVEKSKNDICQKEFLEYIGMLKNKNDKKISPAMENFLVKTEKMEEEKPVENKEIVKEEIVQAKEETKIEEIVESKKTEMSIDPPAEKISEEPKEELKKEPEEIKLEEPKKEVEEEIKKDEEIKPARDASLSDAGGKEEAKEEKPGDVEEKQESEPNKTS